MNYCDIIMYQSTCHIQFLIEMLLQINVAILTLHLL